MPGSTLGSVTNLLKAWQEGDRSALDRLMPLVHSELRRIAGRAMRRERPNHSLQPTALVNEAYLRLVDQKSAQWRDRAHFLAIAAEMMRRVLVDHARGRRAEKRGGGTQKITLDTGADRAPERELDVARLDDALQALATFDPQQARVVELRYFGGLTIAETAEVMGISPATVKRDWTTARAWLYNELDEG